MDSKSLCANVRVEESGPDDNGPITGEKNVREAVNQRLMGFFWRGADLEGR